MPRILTTCPTTGKIVPTILRMQRPAFEQLKGPHGFRCSECREIHHWEKPAAWLEDA